MWEETGVAGVAERTFKFHIQTPRSWNQIQNHDLFHLAFYISDQPESSSMFLLFSFFVCFFSPPFIIVFFPIDFRGTEKCNPGLALQFPLLSATAGTTKLQCEYVLTLLRSAVCSSMLFSETWRALQKKKKTGKANYKLWYSDKVKSVTRLKWLSSVCTLSAFFCVRQCQKCNVIQLPVTEGQSIPCVWIKFHSSVNSIRPTLLALGRVLDHSRTPLVQESPASMWPSPSFHLPAAHLFWPPPQSAGFGNSGSPAHRQHCTVGPRCPGTRPARPRHWSGGGCLVLEWGDTAHCSPCTRHLSGTRYDRATRIGRELLEAQIEEGWGKRSARHPTCRRSGHSPSRREPAQDKGKLGK